MWCGVFAPFRAPFGRFGARGGLEQAFGHRLGVLVSAVAWPRCEMDLAEVSGVSGRGAIICGGPGPRGVL